MPSARRCLDLLLAAAVVPALLISRTRSELGEARASHDRLTADVARLDATLRTIPALERQLEAERRVVRTLARILPSPELATPERLLELVQECYERSGVRNTWSG